MSFCLFLTGPSSTQDASQTQVLHLETLIIEVAVSPLAIAF